MLSYLCEPDEAEYCQGEGYDSDFFEPLCVVDEQTSYGSSNQSTEYHQRAPQTTLFLAERVTNELN